jgi:membrane protein
VAGLLFDVARVREHLLAQSEGLLGKDATGMIAGILASAGNPGKATLATIVGFVTLLFGATAVFVELQDGLNAVWDIHREPGRNLWRFVRTRLLSAAMVFSFGFLLLVSLLVSAGLSALVGRFHFGGLPIVGVAVHFVISVLVTALLFATLFKFLPEAKIRWRDVVAGSISTALLFNLGQIAIGVYLGRAGVGSAYGAAGSLVIVLVWVYYSALIVFFGAEMTQARAALSGHAIEARHSGVRVGQRQKNTRPEATAGTDRDRPRTTTRKESPSSSKASS